jgi:hypothetical protein
MSYTGSCHCGAVTFTVDGDIPGEAMSCNCSHCRRKGFVLAFVPRETFTLDSGGDSLGEYRFASHRIAHQFCTACGCQPFAWGQGPGGKEMASINLRCVPDADLVALTIHHHDGAAA